MLRILKPGGILLFDDYRWGPEGHGKAHLPAEGIDAFLRLNEFEIKVVLRGGQVGVRKVG